MKHTRPAPNRLRPPILTWVEMPLNGNGKIRIGSLKVSTHNLGDYIQILACMELLGSINLKPSVFVDRDTELANMPALEADDDRLLLPLNGWFKLLVGDDPQWPPHETIIPVFFGFHVRPHGCPALLERRSLDYMKSHEPIGCRDPFTMHLLQDKGISAYLTNCLSLTFPIRPPEQTGDIVIVASGNQEILELIPPEFRRGQIYINHHQKLESFDAYMAGARSLINLYRTRARLVITTFLHCALPCIAMGIPVVVFYPNHREQFWKASDRERFSGLKMLAPIYEFEEAHRANWNPTRVDVEPQKIAMTHDFRTRIEKELTRSQ